MLPVQAEAFQVIAPHTGSVTLELPTGSGKTAIGVTFLRALEQQGAGPLFYITTTKALVEQVQRLHPEVRVAYGRGEFPCLYYPDEQLLADEIPCSLLRDCGHRVSQATGQPALAGAPPCPYLHQKYMAKQGGIIVCTMAFYLFTQLFSKEWGKPAGLVIDEAHKLPEVVRNCLSYEITDLHLRRSIELLKRIAAPDVVHVERFLAVLMHIIKRKPSARATLLEAHEVRELLDVLTAIDSEVLRQDIASAMQRGVIDPVADRTVLKRLETFALDLHRYVRSFEYSLATDKRHPLNYTFGFYMPEQQSGSQASVRLFIKAYYVAPLIKRLLAPRTLAYSATIGDAEVFRFESGVDAPFYTFGSSFPAANTRVFMPVDTPNLAMKERSRQEPARVLRKIARACAQFNHAGYRSLVIVISEKEREKFLQLCEEEGVAPMSYGNGVSAKAAAQAFISGVGHVLVGTAAQYGHGLDLPRQIAPVTFVLRPGYPNPHDPRTLFEERRFGSRRWAIWNWRVMLDALQARGRNIRSEYDVGVTFFISQQFRRVVHPILPGWLKPAYVGTKTFDACVAETLQLLQRSSPQRVDVPVQ